MMRFNIKDLNQKQLVEKSNKESDAIYSKESTRKGRTIEAIRMSNLYGLASEQFLIEKCGFNDDPRAYKDVISPQGHSVEIKTTSAKGVAKMLNTCDYWKVSEPWRQLPINYKVHMNGMDNHMPMLPSIGRKKQRLLLTYVKMNCGLLTLCGT